MKRHVLIGLGIAVCAATAVALPLAPVATKPAETNAMLASKPAETEHVDATKPAESGPADTKPRDTRRGGNSSRGGGGGFGSGGSGGGMGTTEMPAPMTADYEVLAKKSMFSKDRTVRRIRDFGTATSTPVVRERPMPVLIGVVQEDTGLVGFVEEPDTGRLQQIHTGDVLPREAGIVKVLTLEYMEVQAGTEGALKQITVGQTVTGMTPEPPPVVAAPTTGPSEGGVATTGEGATATSQPAVPAGLESVAERMRRRRQQSMGGGGGGGGGGGRGGGGG